MSMFPKPRQNHCGFSADTGSRMRDEEDGGREEQVMKVRASCEWSFC